MNFGHPVNSICIVVAVRINIYPTISFDIIKQEILEYNLSRNRNIRIPKKLENFFSYGNTPHYNCIG